MAYTLADKQALERAIASGAESVSYEGKSVSYRGLTEMRQLLATMEAKLAGRTPIRRFRVRSRKGL